MTDNVDISEKVNCARIGRMMIPWLGLGFMTAEGGITSGALTCLGDQIMLLCYRKAGYHSFLRVCSVKAM